MSAKIKVRSHLAGQGEPGHARVDPTGMEVNPMWDGVARIRSSEGEGGRPGRCGQEVRIMFLLNELDVECLIRFEHREKRNKCKGERNLYLLGFKPKSLQTLRIQGRQRRLAFDTRT